MNEAAAISLMIASGAFALFGFLAVASWADARRREREAFYQTEILKKLAESAGPGGSSALELFREQERAAGRRRREAMRLAGLIVFASGIGIWVFLMNVAREENVYFVGVIPMLVGAALLLYGYILGPLHQRFGGGA